MRCIKCKNEASIHIRRHNSAFCKDHFIEYLLGQVEKAIRNFKMFRKEEKILVAVSGGKDSLALWDILISLGYEVDGLHIDLGIGEYSQRSKEITERYAKNKNLKLYIISIKDLYNLGIREIAWKNRKTPCATCGVIKRYIMNLTARELGYNVVATGHNLDDEAATLLGNILHWQIDYIKAQSPIHLEDEVGFARKVKPLYRISEYETSAYCLIKKIEYIIEECPMSIDAQSLIYKEVLNTLENHSPGTKEHFYYGFLEKGQKYFKEEEKKISLQNCKICEQPTTTEICGFCRQMEKAELDSLKVKNFINELKKINR
ncbi:MAG: ATP-binding protein [Dictyoglomus sp.]